jgi:hypothetical protein
MATLEIENAIAGELPDGFDTTLVDEDRLRQLNNADTGSLSDVVADYASYDLTEQDVVRTEVQRVITSFQTPERTLEFPGTALEFANLQRFAAYYKADNDTPSGTVKDSLRAGPDDIVFQFASPEVYEEISGTNQADFQQTGLSAGNTIDIIGDAGADEAANSNGSSLQLDDDEMLYFTGDFIDLSTGQSVLTKMQWTDVDGEDYGPDNALLSNRLSSTHIHTSQGAWVKSTADLDAKAYVAGDAELVPIAFYMAPGTKAASLS